jgi:hypothetical protein
MRADVNVIDYERLTIDAPRLLHATTLREAVKAHTKMLAGIRSHFGG